MNIFKFELRRGRNGLIIWTGAIAAMIFICLMMFPEMSGQMDRMNEMFSSMGSFTEAFGMDRLNYGEVMGFYGVECGNVLGIGGAFFAALIAVSSLAGEEKNHTAEFLLTHPVTRTKVVAEKLICVVVQILILNIITMLTSCVSFIIIGEEIATTELILLHFAYLMMQLEVAAICFAISAFIRHSGIGIGLGFAALLYFLNIIANISDTAEFLKYITPFGYTEAADIISDSSLDMPKLMIGIAVTIISIVIAFNKYRSKDIA